MNHPVFLESLYPVLLLAHLGATVVLIGSMSHNLGCVYGYMKGRFGRRHLEKRYAKWLFWSYLVSYVVGALIYPAEHVWRWAKEAGVPSQEWFAAQAFALVAGGVAGALAHWVAGLRGVGGVSLSSGVLRAIAAVTLLVLAGCMGYLMWHEFAKWGVI